MKIDNPDSYFKLEKGTDVNLAVHAISKAFHDSYDVGVFVSADRDYIPVYDTLKAIGKLAVVVGIEGQNIKNIKPRIDDFIMLKKATLDKCILSK